MIPLASPFIVVDGKVLLLFKKKHNHYEPPGGKVEDGESFEECAIREAKEETGCDVKLGEKLGFCDFDISQKSWRCHYFFGKILKGEPRIMEPDKFAHLYWMPIKEHEKHKISATTREFCRKYLAKEFDGKDL